MGIMQTENKIKALDMVSFTITENCSFQCGHCSRGDRRPNTITEEVIDTFLSQVSILDKLHLGGGEPLLQIKKVVYLIDKIFEYENSPKSIGFATNGSVGAEKFEEFAKVITKYKLPVYLLISNDSYHLEERKRLNNNKDFIKQRIKLYKEIMADYGYLGRKRGYPYIQLELFNSNYEGAGVSAIGRGENILGAERFVRDFEKAKKEIMLYGSWIREGIAIQTNGILTAARDMSWEEIKENYGEDWNILNHPIKEILTRRL